MTDIEVWKTAVYDGEVYEGLYQVSNWGRVRSLGNGNSNNSKERILKTYIERCGYLKVKFYKNGEKKDCLVHRLVAETFLENPENKPEVNHIDENKENNRVDNLEWCDSNYNNNYGSRNERITKSNTNGKCSKRVLQLSLSGDLILEWPSTAECGRNGFNQGAVAACCRGELKQYKGFLWMYK